MGGCSWSRLWCVGSARATEGNQQWVVVWVLVYEEGAHKRKPAMT
jgi:hypothetical protein